MLQKKLIFLTLIGSISPSLTLIKTSSSNPNYKILVNYNGQAELLLSLGIYPDYFPYQFKQRTLYDYLTNVGKYVVEEETSEEKQGFGEKLQKRLNELIGKVSTFGPSLWNEDLYSGGLVNKNTQFWSSKTVDYLFLEQFIMDDSSDPIFLLQTIPKHTHLAVTNFRAARDPYTIFGEDVYRYFKEKGGGSRESRGDNSNDIAKKLYDFYQKFQKITPNNLYRSAKYIEFWNSFCEQVKNIKNKNVNGKSFNLSEFFSIPKSEEKLFVPFDKENTIDGLIAKKFNDSILTDDEQKVFDGEDHKHFKLHYLDQNGVTTVSNQSSSSEESICPTTSLPSLTQASIASTSPSWISQLPEKVHHPALEHQTLKGSSPVSEGTQKELLVYLAQMAVALQNVSQSLRFSEVFNSKDSRTKWIENAFNNAVSIAQAYKDRIKNIREYLQSIGVIDPAFDPEKQCYKRNNSKTLALVSYPPSQLGAGNATIQTISKYSFIYTDLGFKEVLPSSIRGNGNTRQVSDTHQESSISDELFGLDDNGWWWNLGDFNLSDSNLSSFNQSADSVILLATEDDLNILNSGDNPKLNSLKTILNDKSSSNFSTSSYHLWNEGLRSSIALNLLLDVLVKKMKEQFGKDNASTLSTGSSSECPTTSTRVKRNTTDETPECKYKKAMDWGEYWTKQFVEGKATKTEKTTEVKKEKKK